MEQFRRDDSLLHYKLLSYLPFMILTNLATLLLSTVDGLVVGNLVGGDALSAVSIFMPVPTVICIFTICVSAGISTTLSTGMGDIQIENLAPLKKASARLIFVSALAVGIIQIPIAVLLINAYNLSADMQAMVWQYGIGQMIAAPFGMISSVCVYELQILGRSKILTVLAVTEGGINLVLDLMFVGVFHMGIAGAGYGTAVANVVRCTLSLIYLYKKTDIFKFGKAKIHMDHIRQLLKTGSSDAAYTAMMALQSIIMIKIILAAFGESGGAINGVCAFCLSIANVAIMSIQGSARPLAGIYTGARDILGVRMLIRRSLLLMLSLLGVMSVIVLINPGLFYRINGVTEIPVYGLISLRLYVLHFIFRGFNYIFRLYFVNRGDTRFSSIITITSHATLPIFALLFSLLYAPFMWLAYLATECILLLMSALHFHSCSKKDMQERREDVDVLYLTVAPDDAIEASRSIRQYATERGYSERMAYRAALCMEEMIHYAVDVNGSNKVRNQLMVKFLPDSCIFTIMDDGRCIMLNEDDETKELITNYNVIKRIATSVNYQYVLNLNYTVFNFE